VRVMRSTQGSSSCNPRLSVKLFPKFEVSGHLKDCVIVFMGEVTVCKSWFRHYSQMYSFSLGCPLYCMLHKCESNLWGNSTTKEQQCTLLCCLLKHNQSVDSIPFTHGQITSSCFILFIFDNFLLLLGSCLRCQYPNIQAMFVAKRCVVCKEIWCILEHYGYCTMYHISLQEVWATQNFATNSPRLLSLPSSEGNL
jgi:hypothetical protein